MLLFSNNGKILNIDPDEQWMDELALQLFKNTECLNWIKYIYNIFFKTTISLWIKKSLNIWNYRKVILKTKSKSSSTLFTQTMENNSKYRSCWAAGAKAWMTWFAFL